MIKISQYYCLLIIKPFKTQLFIKSIICYDLENLQMKINRLESENIKMREEFNVQRAKMKELFLQKEGI